MDIFISGSLAYDRIMDFPGRFSDHILPDKIHILNVCFPVNGVVEKFGGTAGNIAYSLALLGEKPLILATAGKDFAAYREWLEKQGLPLSGIRVVAEELTAGAYITTDQADNQITGFNPGAMKHPSQFRFDGVEAGRALAIVSPGNVGDMLDYSRTYKKKGIPYIFDPGQQIPVLTGEMLLEMISGATLVIANDYELEMIERRTGLGRDILRARAGAVIVTLGGEGSIVLEGSGEARIPIARAARVADPTGAGDAYRAGLIKGLGEGRPLAEAARLGATCASFAVEHHGTQEHFFTEEEFLARLRLNFS